MNKREEIINVALNEVGYRETKTNITKYGEYFKSNGVAWCAIFICWCADKVGILNTCIPKYFGCGNFYNWYKKKALVSLVPKAGDLLFLKPTKSGATSSHVGLVVKVENNYVYSVEGNWNDKVSKVSRKINDKNILGFAHVEYPKEKETPVVKKHNVIKGDTLTKICNKYYGNHKKDTIQKVIDANIKKYPKITGNLIVVGWVLDIPEKV